MKTYSIKELEALLVDIESDIVERKEAWKGDASTKARQAVCAFANDLPNHNKPGVLFVGAKDKDGSPSGISITDELLRTIADMKTDGNILPLPVLTVEKRVLKGSEYAEFSLPICRQLSTTDASGSAQAPDVLLPMNRKNAFSPKDADIKICHQIFCQCRPPNSTT